MRTPISDTKIGKEIYHLLEQVIETHIPVEIEFKGHTVRISLEDSGKLARLEPHPDCLVGDPEDIVHLDWSGEVHHDIP
ncbi:type II toxin-antitoxin system Phd/YefM family antitoxin [candidate division KSB3 bacterium]|uniref:Type II toxin-antitoxin system Phd/YefM family antitoxin n=1 Tax=candidate division KSB3 bacterium TaxID=2044937 RepID=A0A9D5JSF5_9BACT|nr:type II toxin-antitoxin system Phd/YefM family antitoxin [candidate division KSB3 bacterium]MBD3323275.1 type II toxin-antitoxin system Phd/YefM family antitoxin [candidate division KSB3 bacterium]